MGSYLSPHTSLRSLGMGNGELGMAKGSLRGSHRVTASPKVPYCPLPIARSENFNWRYKAVDLPYDFDNQP